jgi:hypothetical protein
VTTEAVVRVRCAGCGSRLDLSTRRALEHRRAGTEPRCRECRSSRALVVVTEQLRRWWLDRYTLAEIRELAVGLGP